VLKDGNMIIIKHLNIEILLVKHHMSLELCQ